MADRSLFVCLLEFMMTVCSNWREVQPFLWSSCAVSAGLRASFSHRWKRQVGRWGNTADVALMMFCNILSSQEQHSWKQSNHFTAFISQHFHRFAGFIVILLYFLAVRIQLSHAFTGKASTVAPERSLFEQSSPVKPFVVGLRSAAEWAASKTWVTEGAVSPQGSPQVACSPALFGGFGFHGSC